MLKQGGDGGDPKDWYLVTYRDASGRIVTNPNIPLFETYGTALRIFNDLSTLQQRVGNRSWEPVSDNKWASEALASVVGPDSRFVEESGIWTRIMGTTGTMRPTTSFSTLKYDVDFWRAQLGYDAPLFHTGGGSLVGGVNVHFAKSSSKLEAENGHGKIHSNGYGVGGTLTWYGQNGFYADLQGQATWLDTDIRSDRVVSSPNTVNGNDGFGYALSLETGMVFDLTSSWSLTPQAQVIYSDTDYDDFTDPFGLLVQNSRNDSLLGRLGVAVNRVHTYKTASGEGRRVEFYAVTNLYNEFKNGSEVKIAGDKYTTKEDRLWGGVSVGGTFDWCDSKYSVYGELTARTSLKNFGDSNLYSGEVGFRVNF